MKKSEKLIKLLKERLGLDCCDFQRLYAGYWQKKAGGWVWSVRIKGGVSDIGSCDTVTFLLSNKCKEWSILSSPVTSCSDEIVGEPIRQKE